MDKTAQELQYLSMIKDKKNHVLKPNIDISAYPGKQMGMTPQQVREYIKRNKRCLGKSFPLTTGVNKDLSIQLPGTAYLLLGWAIAPTEETGVTLGDVSVRLNNEIVVDKVHHEFFGKEFTDEEYYFIPRPLSGQDSFSFSIDNVTDSWTANVIFYYL